MRVRQLRVTLDAFAAIYASSGDGEKAAALQTLSRSLRGADAKMIDELCPLLQRAATVAKPVGEVPSS
jgi:hypothetical protein